MMNYSPESLTVLENSLKKFLENTPLCKSHDVNHMVTVMKSCEGATATCPLLKSEKRLQHLVCVAGLLHDIDDSKMFVTENYANLRHLMSEYPEEDVDLVVEMVSYVSSSMWGDKVPERAKIHPWLLYPRYADRNQAIGLVGMIRCYQYTMSSGRELFTVDTPRVTDEKELWEKVATQERYENYRSASASMIDHYYDKLLRLGQNYTGNHWFNTERDGNIKIMVDFVLHFGRTGEIDFGVLGV